MPHDVFVCHATEDALVATTLRDGLEREGIACWMAPRDIKAGANWVESIVDAIADCRVFLLVFSEHADRSQHVVREIEKAVDLDHPLVPVRVDGATPSPTLRYLIGTSQWLDVAGDSAAGSADDLVEAVRQGLDGDRRLGGTTPTPIATGSAGRPWVLGAIAAAVVATVVLAAITLTRGDEGGSSGGDTDGDSVAARVDDCVATHSLDEPVERTEMTGDDAVFKVCSWPAPPGAESDGYAEITVAVGEGPGTSEAEGLTVKETFTSECRDLEVQHLFGSQATLTADDAVMLSKGEVRRVEDGSVWTPADDAERDRFAPRRDESIILSNGRYQLDSVRCV